jgi:hypothetical protein
MFMTVVILFIITLVLAVGIASLIASILSGSFLLFCISVIFFCVFAIMIRFLTRGGGSDSDSGSAGPGPFHGTSWM